jgi:hypothetical protein
MSLRLAAIFVKGEVVSMNEKEWTYKGLITRVSDIEKRNWYNGLSNELEFGGNRLIFEIRGKPSVVENYDILLEPGCTVYIKAHNKRNLKNPTLDVYSLEVRDTPLGVQVENIEQSSDISLIEKYTRNNYTGKH